MSNQGGTTSSGNLLAGSADPSASLKQNLMTSPVPALRTDGRPFDGVSPAAPPKNMDAVAASRGENAGASPVPPTSPGPETPDQEDEDVCALRRRNFLVMCLLFGVSHATVTTPIGYATAVLGQHVGSFGNGTLYLVSLFSCLFLGPTGRQLLGTVKAMASGAGLYSLYVLCFAGAAGVVDRTTLWLGLDPALVLHTTGSACGGIAVGLLWTAQGVYFAETAEGLAREEASKTSSEKEGRAAGAKLSVEAITAELAGQFGTIYLLMEVGFKTLSTGLLLLGKSGALGFTFSTTSVFLLYTVVSIVSAATMSQVLKGPEDLNALEQAGPGAASSVEITTTTSGSGSSTTANATATSEAQALASPRPPPPSNKLLAALSLWRDPILWLLAFTNFAFGVAVPFLNGWVNENVTKPRIGESYLGLFAALTAVVAATSSTLYGRLFSGDPRIPLLMAKLSFLLQPLIVLCLTVGGSSPSGGVGGNWLERAGEFVVTGQEGGGSSESSTTDAPRPLPSTTAAPTESQAHSSTAGAFFVNLLIVSLYILQGTGRGAYESTNKAVFADFFGGNGGNKDGAFANVMIQNCLATAIFFFLNSATSRSSQERVMAVCLLLMAACILPGYWWAKKLREARRSSGGNGAPGAREVF